MVHVLVVAAGQKLQRLFKPLWRFAQSLAVRVFANQTDNLPHVASDSSLVIRLRFVQNNFFAFGFHGLGHAAPFSSMISPYAFPAYSKLLLDVSSMRTASSFALGKDFSRS